MSGIDPWNSPAWEAEQAQRKAKRDRAAAEPLAVATEVLAAMRPGSPDERDRVMGLRGIGLALVDIARTLREIRDEVQR